jgi:hypothetical protein
LLLLLLLTKECHDKRDLLMKLSNVIMEEEGYRVTASAG